MSDASDDQQPSRCYRTVFISDFHLGSHGCQAELLLDFLREVECEQLYLVGDIVDGWKLKSGWYWPQTHNDVVQKLLRKARKGCQVIYIPGNHDEFARGYFGAHFGGVLVAHEAIHEAADGRRYLVIHGDAFDGIVSRARWLAVLGDWSYRALLRANSTWNRLRRRFGMGYWSFAAYLKAKVKGATRFIDDFENAVADEARRRGCSGVICGHIHKAEMRDIDGITYINDGDWVESCTAVVEHDDGHLELINWSQAREWPMLARKIVHRPAPCRTSTGGVPAFARTGLVPLSRYLPQR